MAPVLVDVAMGRTPSDLMVRNCNLVNVNTGEIEEGVDVAVKRDRIALVGDAGHTVGPKTEVIDAEGRFVTPGLVDAHMHIESSMLTPTQFARAVLPRGTTTIFVDPHEVANVSGLEGVRSMLKESMKLPLKIYFALPSCVPALPGFETAGATIGPRKISKALKWPNVIGLGEVMNFPAVIGGDVGMLREIEVTLKAGLTVEGHCPGLSGHLLSAYVSAGVTSCHESTKKAEVAEKLRRGMYVQVREGSAWLDVKEDIRAITELGLDSRHMVLVTDDREPGSLIREGHMNHVVRRAIQEGVDPVEAIQMATLNPAEHFGMGRFLGSISPMRSADLLILKSLERMEPDVVVADGVVVARDGRLEVELEQPKLSKSTLNTVHLKRMPTPSDLVMKANRLAGTVKVRAIEVTEGSVITRNTIAEAPVVRGEVRTSTSEDLLKAAVLERHRGTGRISMAMTKGFGFQEGAVASTVAHDSHNMLVVGTDEGEMAFAARKLAECGGGMIAVRGREVLGMIRLPIAGLLSDRPVEEVAQQAENLLAAYRKLGCDLIEPFMTMSLITLTVLPELRLTDKGLLDTVKFEFVEPVLT
jgi:adenine deaminase